MGQTRQEAVAFGARFTCLDSRSSQTADAWACSDAWVCGMFLSEYAADTLPRRTGPIPAAVLFSRQPHKLRHN